MATRNVNRENAVIRGTSNFGASIGAIAGTRINADLLRRLFGVFLLVIAFHMVFGRHGR